MAVTRSGGKRPAETGAPGSSSGKRRKVTAEDIGGVSGRRGARSAPSSLSSSSSSSSSLLSSATTSATSPPSRRRKASRSTRKPTPATSLHLSRSSHGMNTRARARIFRFLDLPAEIRHLVYAEAYGSDTPIDLKTLRLPEDLKVPRMYREALPFFFENTPFIITVIGNWCVRHHHIHGPGEPNYDRAGKVELPVLLEEGGISRGLVRFKQLRFRMKCACCTEGKVIFHVDVEVVNHGKGNIAPTETEVVNRQSLYAEVVDGLDQMSGVVREAVKTLSGRESFNGFTVDDVEALAMCFRNDDYGGQSRPRTCGAV